MPTQYATLDTRKQTERQLADMEACQSNPVAWEKIQDKQKFQKQHQEMKTQLDRITPPDTTGDEKIALKRRTSMLVEALQKGNEAVPPMPTDRQMWDSRAGAVGQHMAWEGFWKRNTLDDKGNIVRINPQAGQRGAVWELKDRMRTLGKEREADDPDVANLETIRPNEKAIPLADSTVKSYGLSWTAKQKYDEIFPDHKPTPVEAKIEEVQEAAKKTSYSNCEAIGPGGKRCGKKALEGRKWCAKESHELQILKREVRERAAQREAQPQEQQPIGE